MNCPQVPQFVKDQYSRPLPGYAADAPVAPLVTSKSDAAETADKNNEFIASLVSMQQSLAQLQTDAVKREMEEKAKLKARNGLISRDTLHWYWPLGIRADIICI